MGNKIIIKKLLLKGINRDYQYLFNPGLNIIEGPIATGKTSLLDFIDFCLGAKSHPTHIEIQNKVRSVLLEIEIKKNPIVIERTLFSNELKATIHDCSIDNLGNQHNSIIISSRQSPNQESISSYIMDKLGLFSISLKESLKKEGSDTDTMSFRDLMWFCYLKNERIDNKNLLFENEQLKRIKLIQVFNVIFKIHDNEIVIISQQIKDLENKLKNIKDEILLLKQFLAERKIPLKEEIEERLEVINSKKEQLQEKFLKITETYKGESIVAQKIRSNILLLDDELRRLNTSKRSHETLLKRLLPLRGQYSEDIKKMYFLQQAKMIINPLNIIRCPICFELLEKDEQKDNVCCLCRKQIKIDENQDFDIKKEIRNIKSKIKELNSFIEETDIEINSVNQDIIEKNEKIKKLGEKLDEAMKDFISPYLSERDDIIGEINRIEQEFQELRTKLNLQIGIEDKIRGKIEIENRLVSKKEESKKLETQTQDRTDIIDLISKRFCIILETSNFPKLDNPHIDENLIPSVRQVEYRKIGSGGALTLISCSWFLSIFESAIELNGEHPGFIMIDSPQKNIGIRASDVEQEFRDTKIVEGLYKHIIDKSKQYGDGAQIIIVDNEAPLIAQDYVILRFTRNKETSPYGLIDDETE